MKKMVFSCLLFFLSLQGAIGQTLDTVIICNGDSVFLYNVWETQTRRP